MNVIAALMIIGLGQRAAGADSHSVLFQKADAVLVVTSDTLRGCDKLCHYDLRIHQILKQPEKEMLKADTVISVLVYSGTPPPPKVEYMIFLRRYAGQPHLWELLQDYKHPDWEGVGTSCNAKGGTLQESCLMGDLTCVTPYQDGGKECSDSSQCAGGCYYEGRPGEPAPPPGKPAKGVCRRDDYPCGCYTPIVAGKMGQGTCAD